MRRACRLQTSWLKPERITGGRCFPWKKDAQLGIGGLERFCLFNEFSRIERGTEFDAFFLAGAAPAGAAGIVVYALGSLPGQDPKERSALLLSVFLDEVIEKGLVLQFSREVHEDAHDGQEHGRHIFVFPFLGSIPKLLNSAGSFEPGSAAASAMVALIRRQKI